MKLERHLFEKSHFYFLAFFLFVLSAFWLTYFTRLTEQESYRMHLHGIALILWCIMLIAQPLLIRLKRATLHQSIGKLSYVLVPFLLYTTFDLMRYRLQASGHMDYFFVALVFNALIAFVVLYGLAIYFRRERSMHARFMLCTVFPMFTPVTDRIISIYFPSLLQHFPLVNGMPNVPLFGFVLADLILIGFCIWDWRSHRRLNAFPIALAILLIYHYSVLNFYRYDFWQGFSHWLVGI